MAFRSTSFFNVDLWTTVVRYRLTHLVDLNFLSFTFLLTVFVACFRHCNRIMFVFLFNLSNVSVHMLAFTNGFHENPHIRFRTQIAPQPNIDQNQQYFTTFWKVFLCFFILFIFLHIFVVSITKKLVFRLKMVLKIKVLLKENSLRYLEYWFIFLILHDDEHVCLSESLSVLMEFLTYRYTAANIFVILFFSFDEPKQRFAKQAHCQT